MPHYEYNLTETCGSTYEQSLKGSFGFQKSNKMKVPSEFRPCGDFNYVYHVKECTQTIIVGKGIKKIREEKYNEEFLSFLGNIKRNNFSFFKKYFDKPGYDIIQVQEISDNEIIISIYEIVRRKDVCCEFNSLCKSEIFLMTLNKNCDIKKYVEDYPAYELNIKKTYKPQKCIQYFDEEVKIIIEEKNLQEKIKLLLLELPSEIYFLLENLNIDTLRNIMSSIEKLHKIQLRKEKLGKQSELGVRTSLQISSDLFSNKNIFLLPPPGLGPANSEKILFDTHSLNGIKQISGESGYFHHLGISSSFVASDIVPYLIESISEDSFYTKLLI